MIELSCFNWVQLIKKAHFPSGANHLALYLATFMNSEHSIAWPSQLRISNETGMSQPTVRKWLEYLAENNWLLINRSARLVKTGGGLQSQNEYIINVPDEIVQRVVNDLPTLSQGGQINDARGVNKSSKGGKQFTPNNNRSNNINNNNEFDIFWTEYPKKKSKGQAEKVWLKIKPDDLLKEKIIKGLCLAKISPDWTEDNGKFIPHPATWLNAKGWEDEFQSQEEDWTANI